MNQKSLTSKLVSLEVLLIGAIALGILLRIINLGSREFWYDEVLSLLLSTGQKIAYQTPEDVPVVLADYSKLLSLPTESSMGDFLKTLVNLLRGIVAEPHPPIFYLSQHLWLRLFGNSEAAMRSLGTVLSFGAIASSYGLGRVILTHRGGLLLAALFATNPFYLFHSLNVRMYGPLLLWTTLSAWALLELIGVKSQTRETPDLHLKTKTSKLFWTLILIGSLTAGLMTFYLFIYWVIALAAVVLYCDIRRCWKYGLCFGTSVLLTIPWVLWGTQQQFRNADFGRFNAPPGFLSAMLRHLQDVADVLGIHLLVGEWVTILPKLITTIAGFFAILLLVFGTLNLWKKGNKRSLVIAFILGIFPLLLALGIDITSGKFTLGFGWGRSMIVIVTGCLLWIAVLIEQLPRNWRQLAATILLLLYLGISGGDFALRPRWMFHKIADIIVTEPTTSTLIVMNSRAWGHVMRLAYYIPSSMPVMLLAQDAQNLASALEKVLNVKPLHYNRVLWLDSAEPVWSPATTEEEKQQIETVLSHKFQREDTQFLSGTMNMDEYTINLYHKNKQARIMQRKKL